MGHEFLRQKFVRFNSRINVGTMNPNGHSHQHMLGPFNRFSIDLQQARPFQRFESEVAVAEVSVVNNFRIQTIRIRFDDIVVEFRYERSIVL